jgi:hypothetical protein
MENHFSQSSDSKQEGQAAGATGGAGGTAAPLPCLNTINCNENVKSPSEKLSSGHRKTAFALKQNVLWMIERHGLHCIGFLTLTFARHVVAAKEAQQALHSLMSGVLRGRYCEYIIVMERMTSKRIHFHLLVVVAKDIRTGFDFAAVKRGDYRSASPYLRAEWSFLRKTAPKYRFGRTELLPIRKTAEGVAKYVGKYVAKHIGQRLPEDKGAKLVRYSKGANRVNNQFGWASVGAFMWRNKVGAFCKMFRLNEDNYKPALQEWFGKNWVYVLRPVIESIKLPNYHSEEEARTSLMAAWVIAANERERRMTKRKTKFKHTAPVRPAPVWSSWLAKTVKED